MTFLFFAFHSASAARPKSKRRKVEAEVAAQAEEALSASGPAVARVKKKRSRGGDGASAAPPAQRPTTTTAALIPLERGVGELAEIVGNFFTALSAAGSGANGGTIVEDKLKKREMLMNVIGDNFAAVVSAFREEDFTLTLFKYKATIVVEWNDTRITLAATNGATVFQFLCGHQFTTKTPAGKRRFEFHSEEHRRLVDPLRQFASELLFEGALGFIAYAKGRRAELMATRVLRANVTDVHADNTVRFTLRFTSAVGAVLDAYALGAIPKPAGWESKVPTTSVALSGSQALVEFEVHVQTSAPVTDAVLAGLRAHCGELYAALLANQPALKGMSVVALRTGCLALTCVTTCQAFAAIADKGFLTEDLVLDPTMLALPESEISIARDALVPDDYLNRAALIKHDDLERARQLGQIKDDDAATISLLKAAADGDTAKCMVLAAKPLVLSAAGIMIVSVSEPFVLGRLSLAEMNVANDGGEIAVAEGVVVTATALAPPLLLDGDTHAALAPRPAHEATAQVCLRFPLKTSLYSQYISPNRAASERRAHERADDESLSSFRRGGTEHVQGEESAWRADLLAAAQSGDATECEAIAEARGDYNVLATVTNDIGSNLLHIAAKAGHLALCKLLVANGADVNAATAEGGSVALGLAAQGDHATVVRYLLEQRADPDALDDRRVSALHVSAYQGHEASCEALLEGGASTNLPDMRGGMPLHWAAAMGHAKACEIMIRGGADPNAQDGSGWSPLTDAAVNGHTDCCASLIRLGANSNLPSSDGTTPLHCAAFSTDRGVYELLLASGAEPGLMNERGFTAASAS